MQPDQGEIIRGRLEGCKRRNSGRRAAELGVQVVLKVKELGDSSRATFTSAESPNRQLACLPSPGCQRRERPFDHANITSNGIAFVARGRE